MWGQTCLLLFDSDERTRHAPAHPARNPAHLASPTAASSIPHAYSQKDAFDILSDPIKRQQAYAARSAEREAAYRNQREKRYWACINEALNRMTSERANARCVGLR